MRGPVRRKSCSEGGFFTLHMMAHHRPILIWVPGHTGETPSQPPLIQDLNEAGSVLDRNRMRPGFLSSQEPQETLMVNDHRGLMVSGKPLSVFLSHGCVPLSPVIPRSDQFP